MRVMQVLELCGDNGWRPVQLVLRRRGMVMWLGGRHGMVSVMKQDALLMLVEGGVWSRSGRLLRMVAGHEDPASIAASSLTPGLLHHAKREMWVEGMLQGVTLVVMR